jgi:hypothetical protein
MLLDSRNPVSTGYCSDGKNKSPITDLLRWLEIGLNHNHPLDGINVCHAPDRDFSPAFLEGPQGFHNASNFDYARGGQRQEWREQEMITIGKEYDTPSMTIDGPETT